MSNLANVTSINQGKSVMPSQNGFVRLWRDIRNQPYWKKDLEAKSIFVELMMSAQHVATQREYKGMTVLLNPGQMVLSSSDISKLSGVDSTSKIERCLKKFEKLGQISRTTLKKMNRPVGQIITLLNYEKWQKIEQPSEQPSEQPETPNLKVVQGRCEQPVEQPTEQLSNNDLSNNLKDMMDSEEPIEVEKVNYPEIRNKAFEHFWKCWNNCKREINSSNTAGKPNAKVKFANLFPTKQIESKGVDWLKSEIKLMCDLAWKAHKDYSQFGENSDYKSYKSMQPPRFFSNKAWRVS